MKDFCAKSKQDLQWKYICIFIYKIDLAIKVATGARYFFGLERNVLHNTTPHRMYVIFVVEYIHS